MDINFKQDKQYEQDKQDNKQYKEINSKIIYSGSNCEFLHMEYKNNQTKNNYISCLRPGDLAFMSFNL